MQSAGTIGTGSCAPSSLCKWSCIPVGTESPPHPFPPFRVFLHRHPECGWSACHARRCYPWSSAAQVVKDVTLLSQTDFYVPVPFTELKIWEHQVRYEEDRRRREIGALGRFQAPYTPPHPPPLLPPPMFNLLQISFRFTLLMKCLLITAVWNVCSGSGCSGVSHVFLHSESHFVISDVNTFRPALQTVKHFLHSSNCDGGQVTCNTANEFSSLEETSSR
jgi:hypothetical protein